MNDKAIGGGIFFNFSELQGSTIDSFNKYLLSTYVCQAFSRLGSTVINK